jgi:hypothetical protein
LVALKKVADGTFGFLSLRHVHVNLAWLDNLVQDRWGRMLCPLPVAEDWAGVIKPILFHCSGDLHIDALPETLRNEYIALGGDFDKDALTALLKNLIFFEVEHGLEEDSGATIKENGVAEDTVSTTKVLQCFTY